jgi:hypothetical protein
MMLKFWLASNKVGCGSRTFSNSPRPNSAKKDSSERDLSAMLVVTERESLVPPYTHC